MTVVEYMPILGTPFAVRMDVLNEQQAKDNHGGQSLDMLRRRGGFSLCEAAAIAERRQWRQQKAEDAARALMAAQPAQGVGE